MKTNAPVTKMPALPAASRGMLPLLLLSLALPGAHGQSTPPPAVMSFQGYLTDQNGNALGATATGPKNYTVIFRVWDELSGGSIGGTDELYAESQVVTVNNGYFSILLGQGSQYSSEPHNLTLPNLFTNSTANLRYVEMMVVGIGTGGGNLTIAPRLQLVTSPYAFLAANANYAASAASLASVSGGSPALSILNGDIGIGTTSPTFPLDVTGDGLFDQAEIGQQATANFYADGANVALRTFPVISGQNNSGNLYFQSASGISTYMFIGSSGNVGIGTTSPGALLEVNGTAQFDTSLTVKGAANITGKVGIGTTSPQQALSVVGGLNIDQSGQNGGQINADALTFGSGSGEGVASKRTSSGTQYDLEFYSANNLRMEILNGGNVGIGTNNPGALLEVNGTAQFDTNMTISGNVGIGTTSPIAGLDVETSVNYYGAGGLGYNGYAYLGASGASAGETYSYSGDVPIGIYCKNRILCASEIDCTSDARVKKIVDRSDTRKDLADVRQLKITDYRKIDKVTYHGRVEKGVIAQEMERIVPGAVTTNTDYIPNIYAISKSLACTNQNLLVTMEQPHGLKVGDMVKMIGDSGDLKVAVTAVPSPVVFAVAQPTNAPKQLFVFGKQVSDLRSVNYDCLFTTGLGAIQELAKQMDELKAQNQHMAELEKHSAVLEAEVADLKKLVSQLAEPGKNSKQASAAAKSVTETLASASVNQ